MKKFENGIHNISNEDYHSSWGISRSALWEFRKSPYHYWNKYINPLYEPTKPTRSLRVGEITHCLVLEPDEFDNRYAVQPNQIAMPLLGKKKEIGAEQYEINKAERERITKINNQRLELFEEESQGKIVLAQDIYYQALDMKNQVLNDDIAHDLFRNSDTKIEQSIFFTHESTGLQCKVRPDAMVNGVVADLKTTADASYKAFQRSCDSYGYFLQAGMIHEALRSLGITLDRFIFYCVEKVEPYATCYYPLCNDAIDFGVQQFNHYMEHLKICVETNTWNAYEPQVLMRPKYALIGEIN